MSQVPPLPSLPASSSPPPPLPLEYAPPPEGTDVRGIAVRQKWVIYSILAYLLFTALQIASPPSLQMLPVMATLAVSVAAAVFVFMLALKVYSTGRGIVLGILTLVPLVGLIVLLVINGKATGILKRHGIRVGLLGARWRELPEAGQRL